MNNEKKVHLIADEKLGGANAKLKREYFEVAQKAGVGQLIYSRDMYFTVRDSLPEGVITRESFAKRHENYRTLEPTDIVVIADQRYRLVDRKASVGEKVVIVNAKKSGRDQCPFDNGHITQVIDVWSDGVTVEPCAGLYNYEYNVLDPITPVEAEATNVEVDASQASPEVIDLLANLAQRIVDLEEQQRVTSGKVIELVMRYDDEIDTLHTNQKRLGEELANKAYASTAFDADEACGAIVELAKLLVEAQRKGSRS